MAYIISAYEFNFKEAILRFSGAAITPFYLQLNCPPFPLASKTTIWFEFLDNAISVPALDGENMTVSNLTPSAAIHDPFRA